MDINELESFKLSDAVTFHEELNPKLWQDNKLDPEVRDQLLLIAEDFVEYLGLDNLKVEDVTISGSNAAYSYTPHSDLDLHVLVDFGQLPNNEVYQELFTAKKTLYNDAHDITVRGVPVELYVQDTNQPVQSLGEYSIVHDKWIRIPKKRRANFDQAATKAKYEKLGDLIELALKTKDPKRVSDTIALVKRYRKSGLDKHGEFGPENLAYKAVRKQGLVQQLYDLKSELHGEKLSIDEAATREDALIKIKKLLQTAGRTPAEKENIKRIVAKMMHQWNIDPNEIGVRKPVDPLKGKIAKAAYEKTMAADLFKQEWNRFKKGIFAEDEKLLDKPEMTVGQLAKKHNVSVDDIKQQLTKGIKIELEHTTKREVAREIALDHLEEDPKYYDKLAKAELEEAFDADEFRRHMAQLRAKEELKKTNPIAALAQDLADKEHERLGRKPKQDVDAGAASNYDPFTVPGVDNPYDIDPFKGHLDEEQLDETVKENQIVNVVSKLAADKIVKIMQTKKNAFLDLLDAGMDNKYKLTLFGLKTKNLDVPNVRDPVLKKLFDILNIRVSTYKDWKNDDDIKTHGSYYMNEYLIDLMFPAITFTSNLRGTSLEREVASTLSHEIQHALDDLKSNGKALKNPISTSDYQTNYQDYLKKPYEVNARFQQALMDIAEYIPQTKKDGTKTTNKDLPDLIRYAFEKNRLNELYSKNQAEYKRLVSRAYKFFDAEMKTPKQVTNIPQNIAQRALNWILGKSTKEINEASGYIPSEKEKNDPRFKTALTVDVKPNSIKKNAKAFNWKTSRAGIPPQARADGKIAEDLMKEWKSFLAEDQEQQELFPGYDEKHRQERLNAWLGKSHAVSASHKPKVLYHATTKHFDQFRAQNKGFASALGMSFEVDRSGIFLAENPKFALEFIEDDYGNYKEGAVVIPVYLSAQYPFGLTDNSLSPMLNDEALVEEFKENDIDLRSIYYHVYEDQRWELFDGPEGEEFIRNLKKLGYDSAFMYEDSKHLGRNMVWVAFDPSQVKAIANRGSFSPDDPRLMKETG